MSDAPERIWAFAAQQYGAITHGEWADCIRHGWGVEYIRADMHAAAIARTERADAALAVAEDALRECEAEIDQYVCDEYPLNHPIHDRNRRNGFESNPARAALSHINAMKGGDK